MGEAKRVLEEAIQRWNAIDRDGWAALYTDDVVYVAYTPTWVALFEVCVDGGIGRCRVPTANHEGPI